MNIKNGQSYVLKSVGMPEVSKPLSADRTESVREIFGGKIEIFKKAAKLAKLLSGKGKTFCHTAVVRGPLANIVFWGTVVSAYKVELFGPATGVFGDNSDFFGDFISDFGHSISSKNKYLHNSPFIYYIL